MTKAAKVQKSEGGKKTSTHLFQSTSVDFKTFHRSLLGSAVHINFVQTGNSQLLEY